MASYELLSDTRVELSHFRLIRACKLLTKWSKGINAVFSWVCDIDFMKPNTFLVRKKIHYVIIDARNDVYNFY